METRQTTPLIFAAGAAIGGALTYLYFFRQAPPSAAAATAVAPAPAAPSSGSVGASSFSGAAASAAPFSSSAGSSSGAHSISSGGNSLPLDGEGRTLHLGLRAGDVANRILSVGDVGRAERIAAALLGASRRTTASSRGFVTHTGLYNGVEVSVVATLMGFANADFVVRECRAVAARGPMAVLRLGTCGGVVPDALPGTVMVATASVCVRRNPDAAAAPLAAAAPPPPPLPRGCAEGAPTLAATPALPFDVSGVVRAHGALAQLYGARLRSGLAPKRFPVREGLDASADFFYASQGREGAFWDDRNAALVPLLADAGVACMQMETFHLYDLARTSLAPNRVFAAAAAIVLVNRTAKDAGAVSGEDVSWLEVVGGRAALEALTEFEM
jgi:uridine phosphorylase